jgi:hypothetical protein
MVRRRFPSSKQNGKVGNTTAWFYMDYVKEVKKIDQVKFFTYCEYLKLKRKPPKVETKPETTVCMIHTDGVICILLKSV